MSLVDDQHLTGKAKTYELPCFFLSSLLTYRHRGSKKAVSSTSFFSSLPSLRSMHAQCNKMAGVDLVHYWAENHQLKHTPAGVTQLVGPTITNDEK
jgi:hypothetical protein